MERTVIENVIAGIGIKRSGSFLRRLEREIPKELALHLILDDYATHKHPEVKRWLEKNPRFNLHFTPTGSSWLNMVERVFGELTRNGYVERSP